LEAIRAAVEGAEVERKVVNVKQQNGILTSCVPAKGFVKLQWLANINHEEKIQIISTLMKAKMENRTRAFQMTIVSKYHHWTVMNLVLLSRTPGSGRGMLPMLVDTFRKLLR
jgi:hypothetical protein